MKTHKNADLITRGVVEKAAEFAEDVAAAVVFAAASQVDMSAADSLGASVKDSLNAAFAKVMQGRSGETLMNFGDLRQFYRHLFLDMIAKLDEAIARD